MQKLARSALGDIREAAPASAGPTPAPLYAPHRKIYPKAVRGQFRRIKSRHRDLLDGIGGYVAESPTRARLLIGPFRSLKDANIIVEDLATVRVDAFSWTSPPGQTIRKLSTE